MAARSTTWVLLAAALAGCGTDEHGAKRPGSTIVGNPDQSPPVTVASCTEPFVEDATCGAQTQPGRTFYVSSSGGSDANDGLGEDRPLATIAAVNSLALSPGDRVLFRCGDVWEREELLVTHSGSPCHHIVYSSYPDLCPNGDQPTLSGSTAVTGFQNDNGALWVADLSAGDNAGKFPKGVNQVFQANGARLPMGKWPNPEDPAFDDGYSFIDGQPDGTTLVDTELPPGDWTGAVIRAKEIRWLLLNRRVVGTGPSTLHLENPLSCYGGTCGPPSGGPTPAHGWGYLITHHLNTLDREGEWYFDEAANKLYVLSSSAPTGIQATPIPDGLEDPDPFSHGGVVIGRHLAEHVSYFVLENLKIVNSWSTGITLPRNLETDDGEQNVLRCNTIWNPESRGINLTTWVWNAGGASGWRGSHDLVVANNVIDGPNSFGIKTYAYRATFQGNIVRNVGLAENLGKDGLGCNFENDDCTEPGDGFHAPRDQAAYTSHSLSIRNNVFENLAYCGIDLFGNAIAVENNVIRHACITKSDGGAVRTFGRSNFTESTLQDITLRGNVIVDTVGNVSGASSEYHVGFGFGLYVDNYSKNVLSEGNTIVGSNAAGILYQNSRGSITGNVLFGNGTNFGAAVNVVVDSDVAEITGNVLYATTPSAGCLFTEAGAVIRSSDGNYLFAPVNPDPVLALDRGWIPISDWQAAGFDTSSKLAWFQESGSVATRAEILVNDTAATKSFDLTGSYTDLDRTPVASPVDVPAYSSRVVVKAE